MNAATEDRLRPAATRSGVRALFRRAAVENAGSRRLGVIVLIRPPSYSYLTLLFGVIALAIVVFLATFGFARMVQVAGIIRPSAGMVPVTATQRGIVGERHVSEGQAVQADDILMVISTDRTIATGANAAEEISGILNSQRQVLSVDRELSRQQTAHRSATLGERAAELQEESGRADQQLDIQRQRVELYEERMKHLSRLRADGFVSLTQLQEHESELLEQREHLIELQRSRAAIRRELSAVRADIVALRVQSAREDARSERESFDVERQLTENELGRKYILRAPRAGTVSSLMADPGQAVSAGDTLLSIVPAESEFEAELYVPSNAVGFLKVGQQVRLRYQAYPYQKFGQHGGVIREISSATLPPRQAGESQPVYRVRVRLDEQSVRAFGVAHILKAGMLVDASISLETRKLYEWILDPLYTIAGRH